MGHGYLGPSPLSIRAKKILDCKCRRFTKWVETEAVATITERKVQNFFWESIICRYGIPRVLVTDNGKQFDNIKFRNYCKELKI
ncbi:hypothetical protein Scep_019207 [Stephania cephalantha]|uniref:Integrase catalytic domain-containing protein n=1 Tax=Stephania cephalantha TaxID=152367 RepID=A0AAP0IAF2_9MAGN